MTTFTIDFNFDDADQNTILGELQAAHYNLIGFKGATGTQQVTTGVPAWFVVPFGNMFGQVQIQYTPKYKVYIYNQSQIAAQTEIVMQTLSNPTELGKSLTFTPTGQFSSGGIKNVDGGSIGIVNDRAKGTPAVTVGLAGLVTTPAGSTYLPFCAFNLPPQNSIVMTPLEQVLLVAAQVELKSGSVQANLSAPGCMFAFDSKNRDFPLMIEDSTFALLSAPGGPAVTPIESGSAIDQVNQLTN